MMADNLALLCAAAASIGFLHTMLGPDHYLPFVAMSRAGGWSLNKTLFVTVLCGIGHVLSSVVLGLIGIAFGVAVFKLEAVEGFRGDLAGWLLLAFGFVYFVWGVRRAIRNKPHCHRHIHANGTMHEHVHVHAEDHVHVHAETHEPTPTSTTTEPGAQAPGGPLPSTDHPEPKGKHHRSGSSGSMTPWVLFTIFVFGPCEPLIPLVMYPAAKGHMLGVVVVTTIFGLATLATMTAMVTFAYLALGRLPFAGVARYSHALAGFVVLLCGAAVKVGL